jgi:hypothetical protein
LSRPRKWMVVPQMEADGMDIASRDWGLAKIGVGIKVP